MSKFRTLFHLADSVRQRKRRRKSLRAATKRWIIGVVSPLGVSILAWGLVFLLVGGGMIFVINLVTTPLDWLSAPFRTISGALDPDDEGREEAREDFHAAATEDPVLRCLLDIPPVLAVNQALYVGDIPEEVATVVAGADGKPHQTTVPVPNSELISDKLPLVAPGSQVVDTEGRPTPAAVGVVDTIPQGTPAVVARAYLVTALAGGTPDFDHFELVATRALNGRLLTEQNTAAVAQAFFAAGTDLRPYYQVADAFVYRGIQEGIIRNANGEGDFVYDRLTECDALVTGIDQTSPVS